MLTRIVFLGIVVAIFSCKSDADSPDVVGAWQSGAVIITYNEDLTYGINYLSKGDSENPVPNDSVFGVYKIDRKDAVITMNKQGHRVRETQTIVLEEAQPESWSYSIQDDVLKVSNSNLDAEYNAVGK